MNNRLDCVEGSVDFNEEIRSQCINIVFFRNGQKINVNREIIATGSDFKQHVTLQVENAAKYLYQFQLISHITPDMPYQFLAVAQLTFSFISGPGQRVWQVTNICHLSGTDVINFTGVYPSEEVMEREVEKLNHCVKAFEYRK